MYVKYKKYWFIFKKSLLETKKAKNLTPKKNLPPKKIQYLTLIQVLRVIVKWLSVAKQNAVVSE